MKDLRKKSKVKEMNTQCDIYAYYMTLGLCALLVVLLLFMCGYFLFNILSIVFMSG